MKISTLILILALCLFIFAPDHDGSRIADDIRSHGLDIGQMLTFELINIKAL